MLNFNNNNDFLNQPIIIMQQCADYSWPPVLKVMQQGDSSKNSLPAPSADVLTSLQSVLSAAQANVGGVVLTTLTPDTTCSQPYWLEYSNTNPVSKAFIAKHFTTYPDADVVATIGFIQWAIQATGASYLSCPEW